MIKYMDTIYAENNREIGIKHCNGFDVYYNLYGDGEYSVDGYVYGTLESAMMPIPTEVRKKYEKEMEEKDKRDRYFYGLLYQKQCEQEYALLRQNLSRIHLLITAITVAVVEVLWNLAMH